jgi:hypothetical protein
MIQVPERPERLLTRIVVYEIYETALDGQNNGRELFWVANVPSALSLFQYFLSKAIDNDNEGRSV